MNNHISILGSGWLGLPLAQHFLSLGYQVKASTTSVERIQELSNLKIEPFIFSISQLSKNINAFLQSPLLVINIPYKKINDFEQLIKAIEKSAVEHVVFISSTSVYKNTNAIVTESDCNALVESPLLIIEDLFRKNNHFETTVLRMGGLIGAKRNPGRFFKSGKFVRYPDALVNLIHQGDCIHIIDQLIKQSVRGEVFNCCADTHPTKREFYSQAAQKLGRPVPDFDMSNENCFKIISNQKLKQRLNYKFLHPDLMKIIFDA